MRRPEELLYDSEACLRLIDHVIEELGSSWAETPNPERSSAIRLAEKWIEAGEVNQSMMGNERTTA
jgi:hypothetical protein